MLFKKKIILILFFILSFTGSINSAEVATSNVRDKLSKITDKIEKNSKKIKEKKQKERTVLRDLIWLNNQINLKEKQLEIAKTKLTRYKKEVILTKKQLVEQQEKFKLKREKFKDRIVQIYKNKNWGFLGFLFASQDLLNMLNSSYFFERVIKNDLSLINTMKAEFLTLETKKETLARQTKQIAALKNQIFRKQYDMRQKRKQKSKYILLIRKEIEDYEEINQKLQEDSNEIAVLIRKKGIGKFLGTGKFIKPTIGWISSRFGYRKHPIFRKVRFHSGLDIAAPRGFKIKAADSGTIIFVGRKGGYGLATIIDHGSQYTTVYAHQSRVVVRKGQNVSKGQLIGYVGNTGYSTGPHLHFEIRKHGQPIDPLPFISG